MEENSDIDRIRSIISDCGGDAAKINEQLPHILSLARSAEISACAVDALLQLSYELSLPTAPHHRVMLRFGGASDGAGCDDSHEPAKPETTKRTGLLDYLKGKFGR